MGKALAPWAAAWRTSGLCVQPSPGPGKRPPHPQQGLRITLYIYHAPSGCLVHHAVSLSPTPSLASWRERQRRGGLGAHCKLGRAAGNNHKVQAPGWDWRGYDSFPRPASVLRLAHSHLSALWVPGPACPAAEGGRVSGVMDTSSCSPLDLSSLSLQPWAGGPSPNQVAPCRGPACLAHLPVLGPVGSTSVVHNPCAHPGQPPAGSAQTLGAGCQLCLVGSFLQPCRCQGPVRGDTRGHAQLSHLGRSHCISLGLCCLCKTGLAPVTWKEGWSL